jgi:hypothetical protein
VKTVKVRVNELWPAARALGLLPATLTAIMDEQSRLSTLHPPAVTPSTPSLQSGGDPLKVAKERIRLEDEQRLTTMIGRVVSDAFTVADGQFKAAIIAEADEIIEGPIRSFTLGLVDEARPIAGNLEKYAPGYDLDEIHDTGTPGQVKAIDTAVPLYKDWRVAVQLWDTLVKASPSQAPIEAYWFFEAPHHADPVWSGRVRAAGGNNISPPIYELLAVASEPEAAGFRLLSAGEAFALAPALMRRHSHSPLQRRVSAEFL